MDGKNTVSTVVAISRQLGSGGAFVGQALARRLGFQYADRDILRAAARILEVEAADLEPLEERVASFWDRMAHMFALGSADTPYLAPMLPTVEESDLFTVEAQIIKTMANEGNTVIVGRGAAHVLSGHKGLIRVFLHAPLAVRVARAAEEYGFQDEDATATSVRRSDERRARFVRSLTDRDWCDALLYDLCLNTGRIGLEAAVDVTLDFVQRMRDAQRP
jgi:cytidylate kinase